MGPATESFASSGDCVSSVDDTGKKSNGKVKAKGKVDVEELLDFIFPKSLQQPLSTGRLYAFGMYGPLDSNARLRAGHNGQRVVSAWEIDTMCLQFEREDILQVYLSGGRPLFVLSDAQQEEVIAQADSHLRTAKGRGYRRQVTRAEVSDLLSGLPRDSAGLASFHDAQKLILGYREKQIARFKVIFPDTVTKSGITPPSRRRMMSSAGDGSSSSGSGSVHGPEAAEVVGNGVGVRDGCLGATTVPAGGSGSKTGGSICSMSKNKSVECFRGAGAGGEKAASRTRGDKFSADVAPPEMFVKDVGFTPAGMAKHTNKLLSTRAYKVGNLVDSNDPGLTQNVRLIREDRPLEPGQGAWDPYACLRGYNVGAHVGSARSSTTAKRKA